MDITQLILDEHHVQRRMFAQLEQIDSADAASLIAVWNRLCTTLEVHALAEEELFYPQLLKVGSGVGDESVDDEVLDVIKDHNEIRDAIRASEGLTAGGDEWWDAVRKVNTANSDHMAEEEREDLTDFRRNAPLQLRHDIAVRFTAFEATHVTGVDVRDRDPKRYIAEHR